MMMMLTNYDALGCLRGSRGAAASFVSSPRPAKLQNYFHHRSDPQYRPLYFTIIINIRIRAFNHHHMRSLNKSLSDPDHEEVEEQPVLLFNPFSTSLPKLFHNCSSNFLLKSQR